MRNIHNKFVSVIIVLTIVLNFSNITAFAAASQSSDYQEFQGVFYSSGDIYDHDVIVDFTQTPSVAFCLTRTDFGGVTANIKDSNGSVISTISVKGDTGSGEVRGKAWYILNRPDGVPDVCTYTVEVKPLASETGSYHLAVGDKQYMEDMVSGIENAVPLGYFAPAVIDVAHGIFNKTTNRGNSYDGEYTPNKKECYFKFTGNGNMTFSLTSDNPNLRFKILNYDLSQIIYDSSEHPDAHRTKWLGYRKAMEKVKWSMTTGQEYYLVVYTPEALRTVDTSYKDYSFFIAAGEPFISGDQIAITASGSYTGTPTSYSPNIPITVNNLPKTASPYQIQFVPTGNVNIGSLGSWQGKRADSSVSYSSSGINYAKINYDWNSSTHVWLNGLWNFKFQSVLKSVTMQPKVTFSYYYELGD